MLARLKQWILTGLEGIGTYVVFLFQAFRSVGDVGMYGKNIIPLMVRIGLNSLPVVMMASVFVGLVTTIQTAYLLDVTFYSESVIGAIVVPSLMLELCALTAGLVLASRVGASIAAELGTMRVTEQIDALEAMGLNATAYLVIPRVVAGFTMFATIYVASCFVAILASAYVGEFLGYLTVERFISGARDYFLPFDPIFGATKTAVFGFLITSIACMKGFHSSGGAEGVGRSTTQAVVTSCVMILIADYVLAVFLL